MTAIRHAKEITSARSEKFGPWVQAAHWPLAGLMIFVMIDGTRLGDGASPARAGMLQLHAGLVCSRCYLPVAITLLEQHEIPWRMMPSVIARPLRLAMARLYRILS